MIDQLTEGSIQQDDKCEGEIVMTQEIQELVKKAEETEQLIEDANNLLDAVLANLEEAYAEEHERIKSEEESVQ